MRGWVRVAESMVNIERGWGVPAVPGLPDCLDCPGEATPPVLLSP